MLKIGGTKKPACGKFWSLIILGGHKKVKRLKMSKTLVGEKKGKNDNKTSGR